jgi:hypothetical protein
MSRKKNEMESGNGCVDWLDQSAVDADPSGKWGASIQSATAAEASEQNAGQGVIDAPEKLVQTKYHQAIVQYVTGMSCLARPSPPTMRRPVHRQLPGSCWRRQIFPCPRPQRGAGTGTEPPATDAIHPSALTPKLPPEAL